MLFSFYKNVPLDDKYRNVIYFDNFLSYYNWLAQYQSNVGYLPNDFTIKDNYIDLSTDTDSSQCNYVCDIIDDKPNENLIYRFYFVERVEPINRNVNRLFLKIDIWATYVLKFNSNNVAEPPVFKPSMLIAGHNKSIPYDIPIKYNLPSTISESTKISKNITNSESDRFGIVALVSWNEGSSSQLFMLYRNIVLNTGTYTYPLNDCVDVKLFLQYITAGYGYEGDFPIEANRNFTYYGCYIVPFELNASSIGGESIRINPYRSITTQEQTIQVYRLAYRLEPILLHNSGKVLNPRYRYEIGTLNNRQVINSDGANHNIKIYASMQGSEFLLYILLDNSQLIDLTQSYSLPKVTDEYAQYLQQNANTLETANINRAVSLGLSLASATANIAIGNYVGGGIQATGALASTYASVANQQAQLNDLKNQPLRVDSNVLTPITNLLYGIRFIGYSSNNDNDIKDAINRYGYIFTNYGTFNPLTNASGYNFAYWRFSNVSLTAKVPYSIKQEIENIFNNGVRIWYNSANFLENVTYNN